MTEASASVCLLLATALVVMEDVELVQETVKLTRTFKPKETFPLDFEALRTPRRAPY